MRYLNAGFMVAVLSASAMLVDGSRSEAVVAQPRPNPMVVAQTVEARKAEADQLLRDGIEDYAGQQYQAACQTLQQALASYQAIQDRQGEATAPA